MCENKDKTIEKIRNLLDLANNNPNENEAIAAALKAQQLMAKYHLDAHDVEDVEITEEITEEELRYTGAWERNLSAIIGRNFCCKVFTRIHKKQIIFYGYEKDVEIATSVFNYLSNTGKSLAREKYQEYKSLGYDTNGIKNQYLLGFLAGIKEVLDKQSTALMIIVPQEVKESFDEEYSRKLKRTYNNMRYRRNDSLYHEGMKDGHSVANARALEGVD